MRNVQRCENELPDPSSTSSALIGLRKISLPEKNKFLCEQGEIIANCTTFKGLVQKGHENNKNEHRNTCLLSSPRPKAHSELL